MTWPISFGTVDLTVDSSVLWTSLWYNSNSLSRLLQVLAPLQGGIPQQTGVIIQPQQIVLAGNKVQQNAQVGFKREHCGAIN